MKTVWIKIALPIVVLAIGFGGMKAIEASAPEEEDKEAVDTRPTVTIETALARDYQIKISSFGEVKPLESTMLSAQVSGEVTSWHPEFVPGGFVLMGDILFSIEKGTYEAAQLQAEANLSLTESQLIEEQARADVAKQEAKNLPKSKVSDLYLRIPQLMSAKAALKSAQSKLKIAQRDLENCDITAPYDALVITRNIGVGQYVNQGAQVAELYNIETAEVTFPIAGFDREFLPADIADTTAQVSTNGSKAITREGFISRDLGIIDQNTRMSQLVVRIEDPYSLKSALPALKFGSYVEVSFAGKTLSQIYRLPQDLVTNRIVWVVDDEQQLQPQRVEILREEGEYFLIGEGVQDQDQVVTTLPEYPQKGMKVKIAQPDKDLLVQQAL